MRFFDTPEMEKLWSIFEPFLTRSMDPTKRFAENTPKEAIEAFERWHNLREEQQNREIADFFA